MESGVLSFGVWIHRLLVGLGGVDLESGIQGPIAWPSKPKKRGSLGIIDLWKLMKSQHVTEVRVKACG